MPYQLRLVEQIEKSWPQHQWSAFRVLVAVSGGKDSVALLRALLEIRKANNGEAAHIVVGHFNHQIRGEQANVDEDFVRDLCKGLGVEAWFGKAKSAPSDEASLRDLRYDFLLDTARKTDCRYIATGHHAADQVETVLFRICRGTGVGGLAGIPKFRVVDDSITVVRPMLECLPESIDEAMNFWGQDFREDESNRKSQYSRNFLRNEILPSLGQRFGEKLFPNVLRLARQADQTVEFIRELATVAMADAVEFKIDGTVAVACESASYVDKVVLRQMFAEIYRIQGWPMDSMGYEEFQRLAELISAPEDVAGFHLPGAVTCRKSGGHLELRR